MDEHTHGTGQGNTEEKPEKNDFSDHFITNEAVSVEIHGAPFKIRELRGGEIDRMKSAAAVLDSDGSVTGVNIEDKHKVLLTNAVVDAPYTGPNGTPYKDLGPEDRYDLLDSLRGPIREKLIDEINRVNGLSEDEEKK